MKWWTVQCVCPKCQVDCKLDMACFSADSEHQYIFICPKCKEFVRWRVYASALAHKALMNDIEDKPKKERRAIQPPLKQNPFTVNDWKELRDMHILDEEGGNVASS